MLCGMSENMSRVVELWTSILDAFALWDGSPTTEDGYV